MSNAKRTERVEMSPGVFKVTVRSQTFRPIANGLYERSLNTQMYFEDAKGSALPSRAPEAVNVTPPGPKWRRATPSDLAQPAVLAKSVSIFEGDDFNPFRIIPVE